ncbi:hypothetical protein B0T13DRAFT_293036 [Neurospora crassa]|nr:hypothetical protein B0T13DRAFT_293036 [Neurospora crassa]
MEWKRMAVPGQHHRPMHLLYTARRITCDRLLLFVLRHLYQLLPLFMARTDLRFMAAVQFDSWSNLSCSYLTADLTNGMPSIPDSWGAEVGDLGLSMGRGLKCRRNCSSGHEIRLDQDGPFMAKVSFESCRCEITISIFPVGIPFPIVLFSFTIMHDFLLVCHFSRIGSRLWGGIRGRSVTPFCESHIHQSLVSWY